MMSQEPHRTPLPRYVGYAQIEEHFLIDRRSVQRLRRDGRFPQSVTATPGKNGRAIFLLDDVLRWDAERGQGLAKSAVTNPDDLSPDEIEYQVRICAAEALSSHIGKPVDPKALELRQTRRLTEGEFAVAETEDHRIRADYLSRLTVDEALAVVATLLPQLRLVLMKTASPRSRAVLKDAKLIDINFKLICDFLTLFEMQTRLTEQGLRFSAGQTIFDRLAEFNSGRAMVLSAWLFPELRQIYADSVDEADQSIFLDEEILGQHAMAALNDAKWADFCAEQRAKDQASCGDDSAPATVN